MSHNCVQALSDSSIGKVKAQYLKSVVTDPGEEGRGWEEKCGKFQSREVQEPPDSGHTKVFQ
jgi:hypothetical protein